MAHTATLTVRQSHGFIFPSKHKVSEGGGRGCHSGASLQVSILDLHCNFYQIPRYCLNSASFRKMCLQTIGFYMLRHTSGQQQKTTY